MILVLGGAAVGLLWWDHADRVQAVDERPAEKGELVSQPTGGSAVGLPESTRLTAERAVFELPPPDAVSSLPPHPAAEALGGPEIAVAEEAVVVLAVFRAYREAFGSYPTGEDNAQFMQALRGGNPGKRALFPRESDRLGAGGELLDAYGTAFFFHQISSQSMEVRSAGADREFYTSDDVVAGDRSDGAPEE